MAKTRSLGIRLPQPASETTIMSLKPCRDCSGRGFYSSSFGKLTCNVCNGAGMVPSSKYNTPRPSDVLRAE